LKKTLSTTLALILCISLLSCGKKDLPAKEIGSCRVVVGSSKEGTTLPALEEFLNKSRQWGKISVFNLNNPKITDLILELNDRTKKNNNGLGRVQVIIDRSQYSQTEVKEQVGRLQDSGIPVRWDVHQGIMHHKFVITELGVLTGSFNFTVPAVEQNDENLVVFYNCPDIARQYESIFDRQQSDCQTQAVGLNQPKECRKKSKN
jgi:phosphatidylserine/phosphatidylglycerophosphate/cardiolipin synthase-like enzyme